MSTSGVGLVALVVDDELPALSELGYLLDRDDRIGEVITASSGTDALQVLDAREVDVVFSDISMPEHDGYWLIAQVRALPPERGGEVPAVALTAHGRAHGPDRTLAAGFQAHFAKPVDAWELCRTIIGLVRRA